MPPASNLPPDAIVALQRGDKIEAIKLTRERLGLGLKEAKDLVEAYVAADPQLQETFTAAQGQSRRGCMITVAVFVVVGLIVYYFLVLR
jgi:hypothetical protein